MRQEWSKPTLYCLEIALTMKSPGSDHGGGWKDEDCEDDISGTS
nr:hypothetical protein [Jeotgalibacillus malaysiensis]